MGVNDLPKPGINFRATRAAGAGSLQAKLNSATRYGNLKNLRDNQKVIVDTIKNPTIQRAIRRGGLSRLQQRSVWLKMKAKDKTITKEDKREIKEVLKYLGRDSLAAQNKTVVGLKQRLSPKEGKVVNIEKYEIGKIIKIGSEVGKVINDHGKKKFIPLSQIKNNVRRNMAVDNSYFTEGDNGKKIMNFVSAVGKTYNSKEKGSAQDLGIKKANVGFAANFNKKLPDAPSAKSSLGGVKPLGL